MLVSEEKAGRRREEAERVFHCRAAFLATLGVGCAEETGSAEFSPLQAGITPETDLTPRGGRAAKRIELRAAGRGNSKEQRAKSK